MRVDEPHHQLVEGVRGQIVVIEEFRRDGRGVLVDEGGDLLLDRGIRRLGVSAGQARHVLAKAVARNEAVPVGGAPVLRIDMKVRRVVVPAAQVGAGRGLSGAAAKGLQQGVVIEPEEQRLLMPVLVEHRSVEQLHVPMRAALQFQRRGRRHAGKSRTPAGERCGPLDHCSARHGCHRRSLALPMPGFEGSSIAKAIWPWDLLAHGPVPKTFRFRICSFDVTGPAALTRQRGPGRGVAQGISRSGARLITVLLPHLYCDVIGL